MEDEQEQVIDASAFFESLQVALADVQRRLAVLETDQHDIERHVHDSLDEIQKGMTCMVEFMREHQKPPQNPAKGLLN